MQAPWRPVAWLLGFWSLGGLALPAAEVPAEQPAATTRQEILRRRREAKRANLAPYSVSRAEQWVRDLETWRLPRRLFAKGIGGFRPLLGGMPAGSGFVAGGGYIAGYNSEAALFTANARHSTRGFRAFDANLLLFPRNRSTLPIEGRLTARATDFGSLRYFGPGGASRREDRTTFRLERQAVEAGLEARPGRFASFGADVQWMTAEASPSAGLESRFDPLETPGIGARTTFAVYGGHAEFRLRDRYVTPQAGVTLNVNASRHLDWDDGRFSFTRLVGDMQATVPLGYRNRVLALRARTSHSLSGGDGAAPFYLMETLGGAQTIRGFPEYRFRDARNLLFNIEYRWEVWTYIDFAFFYDAGKVFADARAMNLNHMKSGYGFGIRVHVPGGFVMRIDLAKSNEGFVLHTGSGPRF